MSVQIIDDRFSPLLYDEACHHPMQAWSWGEARKKMGIEVVRIGEFRNTNLKNAFQMTVHRLPHTPYKIGYIPRCVNPSKEVLFFLQDFGRKNRLVFIKIEPYEIKDSRPTIHDPKFLMVKSPHPLFPSWSQILSLEKNDDELLKSFHSKTRYNIRLAQKKGVVVKEVFDKKGFEDFIKLYFVTCRRQKYFGHTPAYHRDIWETLKGDIAHLLIAYFDGEPLAAYEMFYFKNSIYYVYGGTSDKHRNLMASNLLMWEAIRLGKKLGAVRFDMWGSLPPNYDTGHPWAGFTRFKEGYNTKFVEFVGSFDLVINPLMYKLYNLTYRLRELYLVVFQSHL